jgi:acyl-coenzyme A thioesterase PaaI-like protein
VNGAVVAALCDIAVGATIGLSAYAVTTGSAVGRLDSKMRKPIRGVMCTAESRIEKLVKNLIYARVTIFDAVSTCCVVARGTLFLIRNV